MQQRRLDPVSPLSSPPIIPHRPSTRYTPNRFTGLWFSAFLWGVVFLNNQAMPLFDGNAIRLFTVTVAPTPFDDGDDLP